MHCRFGKEKKAWNEVKDFIEKEVIQVIDEKMALIKAGEQE